MSTLASVLECSRPTWAGFFLSVAIYAPHKFFRFRVVQIDIPGAGTYCERQECALDDVTVFARSYLTFRREKNNSGICFYHVLLVIFERKREALRLLLIPSRGNAGGFFFRQYAAQAANNAARHITLIYDDGGAAVDLYGHEFRLPLP